LDPSKLRLTHSSSPRYSLLHVPQSLTSDRIAMIAFTDLEICTNEITVAAKRLGTETVTSSTNQSKWGLSSSSGQYSSGNGTSSPIYPNASENARQAQRTIMDNASKIQIMLSQPADFLQRLVFNVSIC